MKVVGQLSRERAVQGDATVGAKAPGHSIHRMFWCSEETSSQLRSERQGVTGDEIRGQLARKPGKDLAFILRWKLGEGSE